MTRTGVTAKKNVFVAVVIEISEDADVYAGQRCGQAHLRCDINERTVIVPIEARLLTVAAKDVVPAVVVVINGRDAGRAVLDNGEHLRLPLRSGKERVAMRDEI